MILWRENHPFWVILLNLLQDFTEKKNFLKSQVLNFLSVGIFLSNNDSQPGSQIKFCFSLLVYISFTCCCDARELLLFIPLSPAKHVSRRRHYFKTLPIPFVCVWAQVCTCQGKLVGSVDSSQGSTFSFYFMGSGEGTQVPLRASNASPGWALASAHVGSFVGAIFKPSYVTLWQAR